MNARLTQMESHGVDRSRYPWASFCAGRGWRGHKTRGAALMAAVRDARRIARETGGGQPQHLVASTATGKP